MWVVGIEPRSSEEQPELSGPSLQPSLSAILEIAPGTLSW